MIQQWNSPVELTDDACSTPSWRPYRVSPILVHVRITRSSWSFLHIHTPTALVAGSLVSSSVGVGSFPSGAKRLLRCRFCHSSRIIFDSMFDVVGSSLRMPPVHAPPKVPCSYTLVDTLHTHASHMLHVWLNSLDSWRICT